MAWFLLSSNIFLSLATARGSSPVTRFTIQSGIHPTRSVHGDTFRRDREKRRRTFWIHLHYVGDLHDGRFLLDADETRSKDFSTNTIGWNGNLVGNRIADDDEAAILLLPARFQVDELPWRLRRRDGGNETYRRSRSGQLDRWLV